MKKKTFWQYQRWIWVRAIEKVIKRFGIGLTLLVFLASAIASGLYHMLVSPLGDGFQLLMLTVGVFIFFCALGLVVYLLKEPVTVYNEQAEEIQKRDGTISSLEDRFNAQSDLKKEQARAARLDFLFSQLKRDTIELDRKLEYCNEVETLNPSAEQQIVLASHLFNIWIHKQTESNQIKDFDQRKSFMLSWRYLIQAAMRLDPDNKRIPMIEEPAYRQYEEN